MAALHCLDLQVKYDTVTQSPLTITLTGPHPTGRELENVHSVWPLVY